MNARASLIVMGRPRLTYAFPDVPLVEVYADLTYSRLPDFFRADGQTLQAHHVRVSRDVQTYTDQQVAEVLCHEMRHELQYARWGTLGFYRRYLPQLVRHGAKEGHGNTIEDEAYRAERLYAADFLEAVRTLRNFGFLPVTPSLSPSPA